MEWVETIGKTIDEARDRALDQLGVAEDDAEFEILQEPKAGLFGRMRGEARVRARVRPTAVRPKQDRRTRARRAKGDKADRSEAVPAGRSAAETSDGDGDVASDVPSGGPARSSRGGNKGGRSRSAKPSAAATSDGGVDDSPQADTSDASAAVDTATEAGGESSRSARSNRSRSRGSKQRKDGPMTADDASRDDGSRDDARDDASGDDEGGVDAESNVSPDEVGQAAATFMTGLAEAFGATATAEVLIEDVDIDVHLSGDDLGLLIGPGGRTLLAIQDLVRVAAQRRLGDHETRLRIDVSGYRERRRGALEKFAVAVAHEVLESGRGKALEPMASADRKIVHDAIQTVDGVTSHSDGEDPRRRVVIVPA